MPRNVLLLTLAAALSMSSSIVVVLLGGILGGAIAPTPLLATLPVSLMIVGTASAAVPAALFMQRVGRRRGFVGAALMGSLGALLAAWAVDHGTFPVFCLATFLIGANLAFAQQYRFAAAESVSLDRVSRAVSFVLLGPIAAAWVGPTVARTFEGAFGMATHAGSFVGVAGLLTLAAIVLSGIRRVDAPAPDPAADRSSLLSLLARPAVRVAILAGVVGYGVMSALMTATPISMHVIDGHSLEQTAIVIQSHVLGMYVPSFFTGWMIARWGVVRGMAAGLVGLSACVAFALSGHEVHHYWLALVLLGVGWNLCFVSGTTLLAQASAPDERFRLQAANDFSIFSMTALASLLSGTIVHRIGWTSLVLLVVPALALLAAATAWHARRRSGAGLSPS